MPGLLIRNLPDEKLQVLKARAARNGRSLQQELHALIDASLCNDEEQARHQREIEAILQFSRRMSATGHDFSDSTLDIRADRDSGYGHPD